MALLGVLNNHLRNAAWQVRIVDDAPMLADLLGNTPRIFWVLINIRNFTYVTGASDCLNKPLLCMRIHP